MVAYPGKMKGSILFCIISCISYGFAYHISAPLGHDGALASLQYIQTPYSGESKYHGPPAPLKHDGTVDETPEVKHVKSAHLSTLAAAYAKAKSHYDGGFSHGEGGGLGGYSSYAGEYSGHYHGPPAPLNHDGTVAETPEVKAARANHLAALAKASHGATHSSLGSYGPTHFAENVKYHGPLAPLNHDGTVAFTPEVQHATAAHLATLAEEYSKAKHSYGLGHHDIWKRSAYDSFAQSTSHYHGPPAPLNHDGTVADTPEVKAAKAAHLSVHAKARHALPIYTAAQDIHSLPLSFSLIKQIYH